VTVPAAHGGAPRGWLELSASPNPCGTPQAVRDAVAGAGYGAYADLDPREAERHLAADAGVEEGCVLLTAGATEALRLIVAGAAGGALVLGPTYGEYARLVALRGGATAEIRAEAPAFVPPVERFAAALSSRSWALAFVCDPNNPTGRRLAPEEMRAILAALPPRTRLVIDQSFAPFAGESVPAADLIAGGDAVLVRSLTKILAAPGLRVGYVVARRDRIASLRAHRDPWSPGAHACAAAAVSSWDLGADARLTIAAWRERLVRALAAHGLEAVPSEAPFVLAHAGSRAEGIVRALAHRRIAVRWCASFGLPEHLRVAVRPPGEQEVLVAALAGLRAEARS